MIKASKNFVDRNVGIKNYLQFIDDNFWAYINGSGGSKPQNLCDLKQVQDSFDMRGVQIDYSNKHVQEYYLLRFAYAYTMEYRYMYNDLFDHFVYQNQFSNGSINVTSIGCGSMLDYYGLIYALSDTQNNSIGGCNIFYTGLDLAWWDYKVGIDWGSPSETGRDRDVLEYNDNGKEGKNAADYLGKQKDLESDIYFFPKSMGDISFNSPDDLTKIFSYIAKKERQNVLHIMISRPKNASPESAQKNEDQLKQIMAANGFQFDPKHSSDQVTYDSNGHSDLYDTRNVDNVCKRRIYDMADQYFLYHDRFDMFDCLPSACQEYNDCPQKNECNLDHKPILTTGNVNYKILTFSG